MANTNGTNGTTDDLGLVASEGHIVAVFFVALLIVLTVLGNVIVCACFYYYHELRTICNYFIISLSVADILVALLPMPLWLLLQLYYPKIWGPFKIKAVTLFWNWIDVFLCVSSIMNLVAVSFDRQLAITQPFSYHETLTSFRALLMIAGVWFYASIAALLSIVDNKTRSQSLKWYPHFLLVGGFLLPLFIMTVMYIRIFYVARRQARRIGRNLASDIKAAKTIAIVVGAFTVCWGPFIVLVEGFALDPNFTRPQVSQAMKWLAYLNSCLNPLIYTCFNRAYRRAVYRLLTERFVKPRHDRRLSSQSSQRSSFHKTRGDTKSDTLCHNSISSNENGQIYKAKTSLVTTCLMGREV